MRPTRKPLALALLPQAARALPALLVTLVLLGAGSAQAASKQVRLLIPILTGRELDQVRALVPDAAIISINGESYLQVGAFTDARVAHRLGRSIQKRLAIPFDLAYDPDHPHIALALGKETVKPPHLSAPVAAVPTPKPPANDPIWAPIAASLEAAKPEIAVAPPARSQPTRPAGQSEPGNAIAIQPVAASAVEPKATPVVAPAVEERSESEQPAPEPMAANEAPQQVARANAEAPVTEPVAAQAVMAVTPAPSQMNATGTVTSQPVKAADKALVVALPLQAPRTAAAGNTSIGTALSQRAVATAASPETPPSQLARSRSTSQPGRPERRSVDKTSRLPEAKTLRATTKQAAEQPAHAIRSEAADSHPWLRPVQIAAVKIEAPISHSGVAVNPNLNYLYVKIQNPADVARLNQITPVMELNPVGDTMMARVGVFTQSRTGRRLMEAQINRLRQQQVELIVADGGKLQAAIG